MPQKIKHGIMLALVLMPYSLFAQDSKPVDSVVVIYDSRYHRLSGMEQNFPIAKYDVSLTSTIEARINERLVYSGKATSVSDVEEWAKNKAETDPELRGLFSNLNASFEYLTPAAEFGITKIPAVITMINGDHFVVYGETSIQAAVESSLRFSSGGSQ